MIKSELIEWIARAQDDLPEHDITLGVNEILTHMTHHLCKSGRIEIRGFGSLTLRSRPPRKAHNPKTGQQLITEPKSAVHFKPGKEMKIKINESAKTFPIVKDSIPDEDN